MLKRWVAGLLLVGLLGGFAGGPVMAQPGGDLALAAPGPFGVGVRAISLDDPARPGRHLTVEMWYPAQAEAGAMPLRNAFVGLEGPYPLIVFSHGNGGTRLDLAHLAAHLAGYGFVVAAADHADVLDARDPALARVLTDRPLDVLAVLDVLTNPDDLRWGGLVDPGRVGAVGFSMGGFTVLALSGARFDPASYLAACTGPALTANRLCVYARQWDAVADYRDQFTPLPDAGLWPALSDPRLKAILALAPSRAILFGADGLAAAEVPTLILAGTADELAPYPTEAAFMAANLGGEAALISALGAGHFDLADPALYGDVVNHLSVAYFGLHLQDRAEYAVYLEPEAVDALPGMQWGVVQIR